MREAQGRHGQAHGDMSVARSTPTDNDMGSRGSVTYDGIEAGKKKDGSASLPTAKPSTSSANWRRPS
jgi:hypothetical protein